MSEFRIHLCVLLSLPAIWASSFIYEQRLPLTVKQCFENAKSEPVDLEAAKQACLLAYYNGKVKPRELEDNDKAFFQRRGEQRFGFTKPPTGFRTRREVRTLSDEEWDRFGTVIRTMYREGTLHKFGRLHGQAGKRAHRGAAFLPWHRVFILDFEEEMRRIDPRVFLPYWDYTIDNNITRPSDSIVWSDCFFGNGIGMINTGPFKNMYGGHSIQMIRDIASGEQCPPRLINKLDLHNVMKKCHFEEVTTGSGPYFSNPANIETLHDGVHDWVGGDIGQLAFSAFDPVFFLHHAFIDYIWEKFREHQIKDCDLDPTIEWRKEGDLAQSDRTEFHHSDDTLFGYWHMRNIDGSWWNWTQIFYNYEDQPTCPDCGNSKYLYCDKTADPRFPRGLCMTKTTESCVPKSTNYLNLISLPFAPAPSLLPVQSVALPRIKGLPGDGRTRNMSIEESQAILKSEIGKGEATFAEFLQTFNVDSNGKLLMQGQEFDRAGGRSINLSCMSTLMVMMSVLYFI